MTEQLSPEALRQRVADLIAQHVSGPNLRALDVDPALHRLDQFTAARAIIPLIYTAGLRAGREEARELLEPFAEAADDLDDKHRDGSPIWEAPAAMSIDAGDLRRAQSFIRNLDKHEEGRDAS